VTPAHIFTVRPLDRPHDDPEEPSA
jgi:hypothetical protein